MRLTFNTPHIKEKESILAKDPAIYKVNTTYSFRLLHIELLQSKIFISMRLVSIFGKGQVHLKFSNG